MKGVTSESGGTAYSTFSKFNIEVAGRTGTAQVGNKTNGLRDSHHMMIQKLQ